MKWWGYVLLIAVFFVGEIQSSYSIIVPMICFNFGFPFSKEIENYTGLSVTRIRWALVRTILLWFVINTLALLVIVLFVPKLFAAAYAVGTLRSIFYIGKTKKNKDNISDFYLSCSKYYQGKEKDRFDAFFVENGYLTAQEEAENSLS